MSNFYFIAYMHCLVLKRQLKENEILKATYSPHSTRLELKQQ